MVFFKLSQILGHSKETKIKAIDCCYNGTCNKRPPFEVTKHALLKQGAP
jgi:hypothetical protein